MHQLYVHNYDSTRGKYYDYSGGGGGGVLKKVLYGEALPRGPTPYPFIYHLLQKGTPFIYYLLQKGTPFTQVPTFGSLVLNFM